ncbi:hypothetical protein [Nitrospira sp. BLG_2]|uniref:hypothetical protein n=1 Tax=Nitrospira sp. BLG_2 TaxID=3397507 RepID=UPI003B9B571F
MEVKNLRLMCEEFLKDTANFEEDTEVPIVLEIDFGNKVDDSDGVVFELDDIVFAVGDDISDTYGLGDFTENAEAALIVSSHKDALLSNIVCMQYGML